MEDDPAIHEFLHLVLTDAGCEVRGADFGGKALYILNQWEPDVIMLDMQMPAVNGWDFVRDYRARAGKHAPIICVTAATNVAQRAAEIGADAWLGKPFSVAQLYEVIRRFVPLREGFPGGSGS